MKITFLRFIALVSLGSTHAFVGPLLRRTASTCVVLHDNNNKDDDLFDPLLSPHAYPNGVDAGPVKIDEERLFPSNNTPNTKKAFGFRINDNAEQPSSRNVQQQQPPPVQLQQPDVFDPTLSPHQYPNGTPNKVDRAVPSPTHKIGILLMDHGSRNPNSNQRLHDLAQLYQSRMSSTTTTIVRAAHMEIAEPSIPQVLRRLIEEDQVDQIICHPYFLSPGRHVTQDIPQILQQAMEDLGREFKELPPIVTTDPVGAQTDVMIAAIHNLVQQSATVPLTR